MTNTGPAQPITSGDPVIGTPETVTTQIGATGTTPRKKPGSLLSRAGAAGDVSNALVGAPGAKATLGA